MTTTTTTLPPMTTLSAGERETMANRFLRHEIKNGIIGSLADLEQVRESLVTKLPRRRKAPRRPRVLGLGRKGEGRFVDEADVAAVDAVAAYLRQTLDTLSSASLVGDLLAGRYVADRVRVDLAAQSARLHVPMGLDLSPKRFEVLTDPRLVHYVMENSVSNAVKYGSPKNKVRIQFKCTSIGEQASSSKDDCPTSNEHPVEVVIKVTNVPGPGHDRLVKLTHPNCVFDAGVRLHKRATDRDLSAGDGAWITRRCAEALGGSCDIAFETSRTVFTARFPAVVEALPERVSSPTLHDVSPFSTSKVPPRRQSFVLPTGSAMVALDDEPSQRRLLRRFFQRLSKDFVIYGEASDVDRTFVDDALAIVRACGGRVVFLVDNHLRLERADGSIDAASGVDLACTLRTRLLAENIEDRVLLLVRSAEEDPETLAAHCSRLHGHFPKLPMLLEDFRAHLAALWDRRFGHDDTRLD